MIPDAHYAPMDRGDALDALATVREWLTAEINAARRNETNPILLAARGSAELASARVALQVQRQAVIQAEEALKRHTEIRARARAVAEDRVANGYIDLLSMAL